MGTLDRVTTQHRVSLLLLASISGALVAGGGCSSNGANSAGGSSPVTPAKVTVTINGPADTRLGTPSQFSATVSNSTNTAVTWQVNGVTGGSTAAGTISAAGLYTPPGTLPSGDAVTIGAISQASSSASASTSEAIWNPLPTLATVSAAQATPGGPFTLTANGTSFINGAQITVGGTALTTAFVSATQLQASYTAPAGVSTISVAVVNPNPGSAASPSANVQITPVLASLAAASRLLDQATFGPTLTDIAHVQSIGLKPYLAEQFAIAPTLLPDITNPPPAACATNTIPCEQSEWWQTVLTGPDQLRQRVAFALSEIFVVSTNSVNAYAVTPFQNILATDAFANFQTLMKDVTLSTAMGNYLNMLNSSKPASGQIANENFAREEMQLFSLGLNLLNQDGSLQLDGSGNPIPTYTQAQVQAFARAYTGWTYAPAAGTTLSKYPNGVSNYDAPMAPYNAEHDTSAKTLLNGTTLPAGQTAEQDLDGALANIFNHPNVGPFICQQLIQHLVTSNPSPAYVSRVAAVFADNGSGVRGDMKAVINAILTDTEARAGDTDPTYNGGHLREPMLYLTDVMRGLGFVNTDPNGYYYNLSNYTNPLSQKPYSSGSVFNFFPPDYVIPGTTQLAPEFSLENTASAILRLTLANQLVYNQLSSFSVNLSATSPLGVMAANPGTLVDELGTIFMHGQMPASMRTAIVNHISTLSDPAERVRVATYLIITSSLYKIEH
jgi:uncharacterized protein (DUF1800 family)